MNLRTLTSKFVRVFSAPPLEMWALAGYLAAMAPFLIEPTFLDDSMVMRFFETISIRHPIGADLGFTLGFSRLWFFGHQNPYLTTSAYTPLAFLLFVPFLYMSHYKAYKLITILTLSALTLGAAAFPWLMNRKKPGAMAVFFIVTALTSYGLQFELERGQFHSITMAFVLFSLFLFYRHPKTRWLSFLFFTLAVQLKVYPLLFGILFIQPSLGWKKNLVTTAELGGINLAALFCLGPSMFVDFIQANLRYATAPNGWFGDHSVKSFVDTHKALFAFANGNPGIAYFGLGLLTVGMLAAVFFTTRKSYPATVNPYVLLGCTLCALLLPSISNDYKLPILTAPLIYFFSEALSGGLNGPGLAAKALTGIISFAWSSTLFSYELKPVDWKNNFPALLVILAATTLAALVIQKRRDALAPPARDELRAS